METLNLRPDKVQKTLWYLDWFIIFVVGTLVWVLVTFGQWVICAAVLTVWLIVMALVLLWISAYYRSVNYAIEDDAIRGEIGVFWKKFVTVPFAKITNIDASEGPLQRMLGIGTIFVQTAGAAGNQAVRAELQLIGIRYIEGVREKIREKIRTYNSGKVKQQPVEPLGETKEEPVLQQILFELRAIRELLQNR